MQGEGRRYDGGLGQDAASSAWTDQAARGVGASGTEPVAARPDSIDCGAPHQHAKSTTMPAAVLLTSVISSGTISDRWPHAVQV